MNDTTTTTRELPNGWRWVRLAEICDFLDSERVPVNDHERQRRIAGKAKAELFPYYGANGQVGWIDEHLFDERLILLAEDGGNFGSHDRPIAYAVEGRTWVNNHAHVLRPKPDVVYFDYCLEAIRLRPDVGNLVAGSTRAKLNQATAARIPVPLPPLSEQRRIAGVLREQMGAVARARAALAAQLAAAEALPAAHLRAVFQSPQAQRWPRKRLEELAKLLPSKSVASDGDTEVRAITTACLTETGFRTAGIKHSRMHHDDVAASTVKPGEVLVARSNTPDLVGRVAMFTGEEAGIVASDLTIRIWPADAAFGQFLTGYLSFLYLSGYWKERAGGASGSMKKITRSQIEGEPVPCPPSGEPRAIAARLGIDLAGVTRLRLALTDQLAALDRLPAALLRRAFAGEV